MTTPYIKFGKVLNALRHKYHVTRKELCGALEINLDYLDRLEQGLEQPSEDLVEQLINHFALDDMLATNLWIIAGYDSNQLDDQIAQTAILPIGELKITYTDMVHVTVNNFGVVVNFMQHIGPNNQAVVVSRLGMSKEHARSVADVITRTLKASELKNSNHHREPPMLTSGEGSTT